MTAPFVGREPEMRKAIDHLLSEDSEPTGRVLIIRGDSGTGKTYFAKEFVRRAFAQQPDALYLYADVANDGFQSSRTAGALLQLAYVHGSMVGSSVVSVPEQLALDRMQKKRRRRGFGRGLARILAGSAGTFVGAGSAVGAAFDGAGSDSTVENELAAYLSWVTRKQSAFVVVDNVQFLNVEDRLSLESVVQRVGSRLRFVAIDRTVDGRSELTPPIRCLADDQATVELSAFSPSETAEVVRRTLGETPVTEQLAADFYTKSAGLAKDVEYCLREYELQIEQGAPPSRVAVEGLLATVDRLPLIHRELLVVASLLDGGVKEPIAVNAVRRLIAPGEEAALVSAIAELVERDYLRFNSETGDRLRAGHERVVAAVRNLVTDDLHEDVRRSLIAELAEALESPDTDESEPYLLHCLVGLQTANELRRNVHFVSRLIQAQHRHEQFSYLSSLSAELTDVVPLLPEHALNDLLDGLQKSSSFERGLEIARLLDAEGGEPRVLQRFKFLAQAYRYDEALALAADLPDDDWSSLYLFGTYLSLRRLDDAKALLQETLSSAATEPQAVLRRNAVSLVDPDTALAYLDDAYSYFERAGSDFGMATVETNRSVVHLHLGALGDAGRCLGRAETQLLAIGSREVYQAQLNLALRAAALGDFDSALGLFDKTTRQIPRSLVLDMVKVAMNRTVVEFVAGRIDASTCAAELQRCAAEVRGVRMPYVQDALKRNLAILNHDEPEPVIALPGAVSTTLLLSADGQIPAFSLNLSIHWRH